MSSTAIRLYFLTVLVVSVPFGSYLVRAGLEPPATAFPDWQLDEFPLELGDWKGEDRTDLEVDLRLVLNAKAVLDRVYRDDAEHAISLHMATFADPEDGIYHTPLNCYRAQGWQQIKDWRVPLQLGGKSEIQVRFCSWQRDGNQALVAYWFQFGEHTLFNRMDLGMVRWDLRGQETWPALIKVMLHIPMTNDPEDDEAEVLHLARKVYEFILNGPDSQPSAESPDG